MGRILLLLAGAAILALPASAAARPASHRGAPGFLVVRNAEADGGVTGSPVATVAVRGFVIGRVAQEGVVQIFHPGAPLSAQVAGGDVRRRIISYHGVPGTEFIGSNFRFRAVGGVWRVVISGAGVSLYAGGQGLAHLHGSVAFPRGDGQYSVDGGRFTSLPSGVVTRRLGTK